MTSGTPHGFPLFLCNDARQVVPFAGLCYNNRYDGQAFLPIRPMEEL